jgi:hypothetical protein
MVVRSIFSQKRREDLKTPRNTNLGHYQRNWQVFQSGDILTDGVPFSRGVPAGGYRANLKAPVNF